MKGGSPLLYRKEIITDEFVIIWVFLLVATSPNGLMWRGLLSSRAWKVEYFFRWGFNQSGLCLATIYLLLKNFKFCIVYYIVAMIKRRILSSVAFPGGALIEGAFIALPFKIAIGWFIWNEIYGINIILTNKFKYAILI